MSARKTAMLAWLTPVFALLFALCLGTYLITFIGCQCCRRRQNLARKYGAKWALVTGASSGIGLAIVEALAAQVRACETLSRRGHGRLLRYVMSTWGYLEPILECFRSPRHQAEWHCSSAAHPRPLLAGCLPADTARRVHVSPTSIAELVARISHCCALGPGG